MLTIRKAIISGRASRLICEKKSGVLGFRPFLSGTNSPFVAGVA